MKKSKRDYSRSRSRSREKDKSKSREKLGSLAKKIRDHDKKHHSEKTPTHDHDKRSHSEKTSTYQGNGPMMFVGNRTIKKTPNVGIEKRFQTPSTVLKSEKGKTIKDLDPKEKAEHMRNLLEGYQMTPAETAVSLQKTSKSRHGNYDDYAAFEWEEQNKDVDRDWYDNDELGGCEDDYNVEKKFIGDAEVFEAMEQQLELRNQQMQSNKTGINRMSVKQREKSEEQNKWELNRMITSGIF